MQIRAGTGGDEAALFVGDLLRMYQRYAEEQSWKISSLSESASENGGLKEAIVQVRLRIASLITSSAHLYIAERFRAGTSCHFVLCNA